MASSYNDREDAPLAESSPRDSNPAIKRPVASTCLVMNILLPGLVTTVADLQAVDSGGSTPMSLPRVNGKIQSGYGQPGLHPVL
ncbi:hypothetical protein DPMN_112604 [Dreissena polymorpha]|uniref:Uncharacterized protein n=1 Tax=Dreissena polymorpha TaxID=45954 RepID=A0A9D4KGT9_DREPO|nr:hypothetical protein DPMN_112604 [Dreissena polymorpha]